MNYAKQAKLTLFAENAQTIKNGFIWQGEHVKRLAALLYALENKPVDCDAIKACHNMIKSNTGAFSSFRGNMSLCVAAMLSLRNDREELLANTLTVYDMLKKARLAPSDYLVVAAYQIAANAPKERLQQAADNTRAFYDAMKARRFFHTGQDDYIFAAMLGLSDILPDEGAERIEKLFQLLKSKFSSRNSVQTLSQILVLGGQSDEAARHTLILRDTLKSRKIRLDKIYTLPALGVLALMPVDGELIALDMIEAQDFLRAQKGFSSWSVTQQELLMYISAVISSGYAEDVNNGILKATVSTSITSIIIAQQTAMIAAAAASSSAAAAAASSS